MQQNSGGMTQKKKLINSKRLTRLKLSHSSMLFLSDVSILVVLFCLVCIAFHLLPHVVCILLPYAICTVFGLILYLFLVPLHEAGHFYASLYYIKRYNIPAKVYIKRSKTVSAEWKNFGYDKCASILKNGSRIKIGYCIIMFFLILLTGHIKGGIVSLFTVAFEYSLNCTPIRNGNDYDLIQNIEKFYEEKDDVSRHWESLERFRTIRIVIWGVFWQIIIIALSVVVLDLLYKVPFDAIDVLKNFIMDYSYGKQC